MEVRVTYGGKEQVDKDIKTLERHFRTLERGLVNNPPYKANEVSSTPVVNKGIERKDYPAIMEKMKQLTEVSDEMCKFLNVKPGTRLSRYDVTRRILEHSDKLARNHGSPSSVHHPPFYITHNGFMQDLLKPDGLLTYHNLQKCLDRHLPNIKITDCKKECEDKETMTEEISSSEEKHTCPCGEGCVSDSEDSDYCIPGPLLYDSSDSDE